MLISKNRWCLANKNIIRKLSQYITLDIKDGQKAE